MFDWNTWKKRWVSLMTRIRDSRLLLMYKSLKGAASVPTDDLITPIRRCKNDHSLALCQLWRFPSRHTTLKQRRFDVKTLKTLQRLCFNVVCPMGILLNLKKKNDQTLGWHWTGHNSVPMLGQRCYAIWISYFHSTDSHRGSCHICSGVLLPSVSLFWLLF